MQPVRETVSYRGLFTAGWFGVREKHCSWLEIYDHLRASEQAEYRLVFSSNSNSEFLTIQTVELAASQYQFQIQRPNIYIQTGVKALLPVAEPPK